jgi:hypothetical protein
MYRRNYEKLCLKTAPIHYWLGLEVGFLLGLWDGFQLGLEDGFQLGFEKGFWLGLPESVIEVNTNTSRMPRKDLSFQRFKTTKGKANLQNVMAP